MSRIKELINELYSNEGYNEAFVKNASLCNDCETIPKVENAGEILKINNENCIIMHNGVMIYENSYHGIWMSDIIKKLRGHHEPQEEKLFYEVLKYIESGSTMVECGSSWGYYSLWFHKEILNSKNILIEPNPYKLEMGKLNFLLNGFDGEFINGYIGDSFVKNSTFVDWDRKEFPSQKITIDSIFENYSIKKINVLHADIQHNEDSLLKGSLTSFKNELIDFVFLGTHSNNTIFKNFFKNVGYKIICDFEVGQSFGDDGLILACSPTIYKKINLNNFIITKKQQ